MATKEKDDKKKKIAIGAGIAGIIAALIYLLTGRARASEGDTQCLGFDFYEYQNGQWILVEASSTACGWSPGDVTFQLSNLIIEPLTVNVGEPVAIKVTVTNTSEVQGTKTVVLGGDVMETQDITLGPGQSGEVSFEVTPQEAKTYSVSINGLTCSFNVIGGEDLISVYDVFLTSNYDPPSAADNYIHARIKNNGSTVQTCKITAYYWESWMDLDDASHSTQTITINPGEVVEYLEHFHGNDYTEYDSAVWLKGDWTEELLTHVLSFRAGMHLSSDDPDKVDLHIHELGADYVILRYMQLGTCNKWEYGLVTPPTRPYEQSLKGLWYTSQAYCGYWLVPNLLPGRLYEAHCEGGTTANLEDRIQFNT